MPDPEAASGWPKAMAPPLTLVLALSSPRSFSTARYWAKQKCSVLLKKPCDAHLNNTICAISIERLKLSELECCYVIDWTD